MHLKQGDLPFRDGFFRSGTVFTVRERSLPFWDIHECSRKKNRKSKQPFLRECSISQLSLQML
jgi:hypothetical protein